MLANVKPFGGFVTPRFACAIIGYVTAALSVGGSLGAFLRIMVASSDSRIIPEYEGAVKVNTMLFLFPGIYCLLRTSTSLLLIWGSKIECAQLMLPWIVTGIIDIILSIVGMVVLGVAATQTGAEHFGPGYSEWFAGGAGVCAFLFVLMVYFMVCVMSYFEDLLKKPHSNIFKNPRWAAAIWQRNHDKEAAPNVNSAFEA